MSKEIYQGPVGPVGQESPAKLTIGAQNLYSGERNSAAGDKLRVNIFMAEDQGEVPKLITPASKRAPAPAKRPTTVPPKQETKSHTAEEKEQIAQIGEAIKKMAGTPAPGEFHQAVEERLTEGERARKKEIVGGQEAQRLTKEVVGFNQLGAEPGGLVDQFGRPIGRERRGGEEERQAGNMGRRERRKEEFLDEEDGEDREAETREGMYGARMLRTRGKEKVWEGGDDAERLFNRMFIRVDARPKEQFREAFGTAGEIEFTDFINALTEGLEKKESPVEGVSVEDFHTRMREMLIKYGHEKDLREILHDANYALLANVSSEDFVKFFHGRFTSDMADTAYRTEGVTLAAHMYEQALRQVIDENGGYLPAVEVATEENAPKITGREGRVEELARKYFENAMKEGLLKDDKGRVITESNFPVWKARRAISLARGMGIVTMRTIEILGAVKLPSQGNLPPMPSLYGQDIVKDLVPFRHLFGKFGVGKERLAVLGFKTGPGGRAWSQKELLDFKNGDVGKITNGESPELGERYIERINPLESGSIYSHTGWRAGVATVHLAGEGVNKNEWIGSGVRLERLRSKVNSKDPKEREEAQKEMVTILKGIAEIQPLKLFREMPNLGLKTEHEAIRSLITERESQLEPEKRGWTEMDLAMLQEKMVQGGIAGEESFNDSELDFNFIRDGGRRDNARELAEAIKGVFLENGEAKPPLTELAEKIGDKDWPFVFGTEDVPFDKYQFVETGPTGLARTLRDFGAESRAAAGVIKLVRKMDSYRKQEDIITDLREIYENISQYNEDTARSTMMELSEGVIKFYAKDWQARLPFGVGSLVGFAGDHGLLPNHRRSSYAKTVFGKGAPAWDETEKRKFVLSLHAAGMLDYKQLEELEKRVGATIWHLAGDEVRTYGPLGIIIFLVELGKVVTKDIEK